MIKKVWLIRSQKACNKNSTKSSDADNQILPCFKAYKLLASFSMLDCFSSRPPVYGHVPGLLEIEGMRRQTVAERGWGIFILKEQQEQLRLSMSEQQSSIL